MLIVKEGGDEDGVEGAAVADAIEILSSDAITINARTENEWMP
jgi:hypothetical protein